jgi:hypothetical protein
MIRPMTQAQTPEDIRDRADEVARLMADRFGGARRGEFPRLAEMIRRRGAALPRRLRGQAKLLAEADQQIAHPRIARQMDLRGPSRAHAALTAHLRPLGGFSRWQNRAVNFAASIAFALLVLGAVVLWVMVQRGHL